MGVGRSMPPRSSLHQASGSCTNQCRQHAVKTTGSLGRDGLFQHAASFASAPTDMAHRRTAASQVARCTTFREVHERLTLLCLEQTLVATAHDRTETAGRPQLQPAQQNPSHTKPTKQRCSIETQANDNTTWHGAAQHKQQCTAKALRS